MPLACECQQKNKRLAPGHRSEFPHCNKAAARRQQRSRGRGAKKKRNLGGCARKIHQRRRFWRNAPSPLVRRRRSIIPAAAGKCKRFLLLCNIVWTRRLPLPIHQGLTSVWAAVKPRL